MPPQEDLATAAVNMHTNVVKFGSVVFEICEHYSAQTDTHITNSQYFTTWPGTKEQ